MSDELLDFPLVKVYPNHAWQVQERLRGFR